MQKKTCLHMSVYNLCKLWKTWARAVHNRGKSLGKNICGNVNKPGAKFPPGKTA